MNWAVPYPAQWRETRSHWLPGFLTTVNNKIRRIRQLWLGGYQYIQGDQGIRIGLNIFCRKRNKPWCIIFGLKWNIIRGSIWYRLVITRIYRFYMLRNITHSLITVLPTSLVTDWFENTIVNYLRCLPVLSLKVEFSQLPISMANLQKLEKDVIILNRSIAHL